MSDNSYDPIQSGNKKSFLKDTILGSDEEYEEYLREQKTSNTEKSMNTTANSVNEININNVTYSKNYNVNNEIKGVNSQDNYNRGAKENGELLFNKKDLLSNLIITIMLVVIVSFAGGTFMSKSIDNNVEEYDASYSNESLSEEEKNEILKNGGVVENYTYNESIDWQDDKYNVKVSVPTYYSFSNDTNVVSSAAYSPDNRFPVKNCVFDVEIEYDTLNSIALSNYETYLLRDKGYKNVYDNGNKSVFVKAINSNTYEFVIREYAIFTYGFCFGDYRRVLGVNLTTNE